MLLFYCGVRLADPAIRWSGFTADIFLHGRCTEHLIIRLARDVHELETMMARSLARQTS
jgi:hypothetical protein